MTATVCRNYFYFIIDTYKMREIILEIESKNRKN